MNTSSNRQFISESFWKSLQRSRQDTGLLPYSCSISLCIRPCRMLPLHPASASASLRSTRAASWIWWTPRLMYRPPAWGSQAILNTVLSQVSFALPSCGLEVIECWSSLSTLQPLQMVPDGSCIPCLQCLTRNLWAAITDTCCH